MKTQQQIEKFIETVENLIPKLEEKQLEYLRQGDEFGFNVLKDKIKERLIELNTVRWVLDNSTNDTEEVKSQVDTKWISVKNALPPNDTYNREYWVYETLNNKVQHDYWVCPDSELDQDFKPFFNNWFDSVTHWMPMVDYPNPPTR